MQQNKVYLSDGVCGALGLFIVARVVVYFIILLIWFDFLMGSHCSAMHRDLIPNFGVQSIKRKTEGFFCTSCDVISPDDKSATRHILNVHYACPWCDDLPDLQIGVWKECSNEVLAPRQQHIAECAKKNNTSLWLCRQCNALSHHIFYAHACDDKLQINLVNGETLSEQRCLDRKKRFTCPVCEKKLTNQGVRENHLISVCKTCPWCLLERYNPKNPDDKKRFYYHVTFCALTHNVNNLYGCDNCYNLRVSSRKFCPKSCTNSSVYKIEPISDEAVLQFIECSGPEYIVLDE